VARISNEVIVARPLTEVFAYVADLNNYSEWASGVLDVHPDETDMGAFVLTRRLSGRTLRSRFKVIELVPNERIVLQGESAGVPWRSTLSFDDRGDQTGVRGALELRMDGLTRLASPLLSRMVARSNRADLEGLKQSLEAAARRQGTPLFG
jgi:uncharacterized membrane protein